MKSLSLPDYDIHVLDYTELLGQLNSELRAKPWSSVFVMVDELTHAHCWPLVRNADWPEQTHLVMIPAGEVHKSMATCCHVWEEFVEFGADRHSLLVNLGGGVVGDLGGFAASTFMRGFEFLNIPTTLLAQVDASVGGKLGVDFRGLKNMIGLFRDPQTVLLCPEFLKTLPAAELRSGWAEVLKHAMIRDEKEFSRIQDLDPLQPNGIDWPDLIARSVGIKRDVVELDRLEGGLRKVLNFGHTVGHALETASFQTERSLLHGEAIAAGMLCEAWLSSRVSGLPGDDLERISGLIRKLYPRVQLEAYSVDEVLQLMKSDKKNRGGQIKLSLLQSLGSCTVDQSADEELIKDSLGYYADAYGS